MQENISNVTDDVLWEKITLSWKVTRYFSAIFIGNTEGRGLLSDNEAAD